MKKWLLFISLLTLSIFVVLDVHASSFKLSFSGSETFDDTMTITLNVDSLTEFDGTCGGLCGLVGTLEYDEDKIEIVSIDALNDFTLAQGKKLVLYKAKGVEEGSKILTIKIKNKGLQGGESTKITLFDIVASDGAKDIAGSIVSKTIKLVENKEDDTASVVKPETSKPNNKESSSINKKEESNELSNDNNLTEITLSVGKVDFDKDVLDYNVNVDYDVSEIIVDAKTLSSGAKVEGLGTFKLDKGNNLIKIVVYAENGDKKTYTLNVYREDDEEFEDESEKIDYNIEENNDGEKSSLLPSVIIIVLLVIGILTFMILKNKKK